MKIEVGDTIRLKSSLKIGEEYNGFTFRDKMDYRPLRLTIIRNDYDNVYANVSGKCAFWYPLSMLDMRTLRKAKEKLN